ncbi:MAG: hypothetical protein AAGA69_02830, partial [Pseudomonadota bacterium]
MAPLAPIAKAAAAALIFTLAACGGDVASTSETAAEKVTVGEITVQPAFVRKPASGAFSTAAYLEIIAASNDRLVGASSDLATVEIH